MFEFSVSALGKYTVKVSGHWLDKWNVKRRCYEVVEFRSKTAAEKAAKDRLAYHRAMFG